MSGHSKWATIKHKKGALDAKRGKIFTRLIKEITIAAKRAEAIPTAIPACAPRSLRPRPRTCPQDNIKRAIQRGTGELEGVNYEEITFEGYGPGGVAIIVEVTTDNRNRAVSEIRHAFSKNGGNLGETGSVRFHVLQEGRHRRREVRGQRRQADGHRARSTAAKTSTTKAKPGRFSPIPATSKRSPKPSRPPKITPVHAEVTMIASTYTKLEGTRPAQMIRLLEALEDLRRYPERLLELRHGRSRCGKCQSLAQRSSRTSQRPPFIGGFLLPLSETLID